MDAKLDEGFDLRKVGLPVQAEPSTQLLEKEVTKKFRFRNKEWQIRISALDAGRRQIQQRAEVQLAESVPFDKLSSSAQMRVKALAMITACAVEIPADLSKFIQTWDAILFDLYEVVEGHSERYFLGVFGEDTPVEETGDGD